MAFGTAPHRLSPGVWVTSGGRPLTAAGSAYWEHHFRLGLTDGRGHVTTPSVVVSPPPPPHVPQGPTVRPGRAAVKPPSFFEHVQGVVGHNPDAQRRERLHQQTLHQPHYNPHTAQSTAADRALEAQNPHLLLDQIITDISPYTALKETGHALQHGNLLKAGLAASAILPVGPGRFRLIGKAAKDVLETEAAARAAGGAEKLVTRRRQILPRPSLAPKGAATSEGSKLSGENALSAIKSGKKPSGLVDEGTFKQAKQRGLPTLEIQGKAGTYYLVAKDDRALRRLKDAVTFAETQPGETAHSVTAIGRALGYPERDIAAYIKANKLPYGKAYVEKLMPEDLATRMGVSAQRAYAEQAGIRSEELSRRVKNLSAAYEEAGGGEAGLIAKKGELKGALPRAYFGHLDHLDQTQLDHLLNAVQDSPALKPLEKTHLQNVFIHTARQGHVPTPYDVGLVKRAFGSDMAAEFAALSWKQKTAHYAMEVLNTPRAIMSSADLSAMLRQAFVMSMYKPGLVAKNVPGMLKMMKSETFYQDTMKAIEQMPRYQQMLDDGVVMTGLGDLGKREEFFQSNLAEKITGLGKEGRSFVRWSGRAYTGFLNNLRAQAYHEIMDAAELSDKAGPNVGHDVALFVNRATGRGGLGKYGEKAAVPLNTIFFAPRLFASRLQVPWMLLNPDTDPFVRRQVANALVKTVGAGMAVLLLAKLAGAKVGADPRSADFGKIKVGNHRVDIWAGHQQIAKLVAQLGTQTVISSTTGKRLRLRGGAYNLSSLDIINRFAETKYAPTTSFVHDALAGTDFAGKPFSVKKALIDRSYPLLVNDILQVYHQQGGGLGGVGVGAGLAIPGIFGVGIQSYGPKAPLPQDTSNDPWANLSGSDNPFLQSGKDDPWANLGAP